MSEELIDKISSLQLQNETGQIEKLIGILSNNWVKGLTALKRSQVLINRYGDSGAGNQIAVIIDSLSKNIPKKYLNRYKKYFKSIIPLNNLLGDISKNIVRSEFWKIDKEVCLTSLLARFEAEYAHIENEIQTLLREKADVNDTIHMRTPLFLRTDDGGFVEADKKIQQLAASLDTSLRFIEYNLNRIPLANINTSAKVYKAGAFQIAGELWNSIFYLINKVSLFDWYATIISNIPETLYYQPKNKTEYICKIIGDLRESQWIMQQFMETENKYKSIKKYIKFDERFAPRNELELRAHLELCEMCSDEKILNVKFKNGLKVKDFIRAWVVIAELSKDHFNEKKISLLETEDEIDVSDLLLISAENLMDLLKKKGGLALTDAQKCIELFTYWNMDHDVFSSPLFPTPEDGYIVLTSIFISGNPARSVFRLLSHDEIDISFKGISFEKKLDNLFREMGFKSLAGLGFSDASGKGEIDCIAYKENTFFVCECKNIVPNESSRDRYRTLKIFTKKASNQANRGARFVGSHLHQICEQLSVSIANREEIKIFPFIITNLFGFSGLAFNGVHVCDISALKRFADGKYVNRTIVSKDGKRSEPVKELYKGDTPNSNELLEQLRTPFQMRFEAKKLVANPVTQRMNEKYTLRVYDVRENENSGGNL